MTILYTPTSIPLARPSVGVGVFRYDSEAGTYTLLPNVLCTAIRKAEGPDPWLARFRYVFLDPLLDPDDPRRIEQVYPLDATGPRVVQADDRLVVNVYSPDGSVYGAFDGFAQVPQGDLGADTEAVTFTAIATIVREFDRPLGGALTRDAEAPLTVSDHRTSQPARFNPDGKPNATPTGSDAGTTPCTFPTFLGPVSPANTINGQTLRWWTLAMAARYVIMDGLNDAWFVTIDSLTYLDTLLQAIVPVTDGGVIDMEDSSTYKLQDIFVQDVDVTGQPWPEALQRLIEPHGFTMKWILEADGSGNPLWKMRVYRTDLVRQSGAKTLSLQQAGNTIDPGQTNVGALSLARDSHGIANAVRIDSAPVRYEAGFVLAPGFVIGGSDDPNGYKLPVSVANHNNYRLFVFDECGEGHWDLGTDATVNTVASLDAVLNAAGAKSRPYAHRRRPGTDTMISVDGNGKPLKSTVALSFDYTGPEPGVWDGTGTWQDVPGGSWNLTPDRLGIYLTMPDPNAWNPGPKFSIADGLTVPAGTGKVNLIEWIIGNTLNRPRIKLTCVIPSDRGLGVIAHRRASSPTKYVIERHVDARDRFRKDVINVSSDWNITGDEEIQTDDTPDAKSHAAGVQRAHEMAVFAGNVTIPRFTAAYRLGDRISQINGRNLSLQTNVASSAGESPSFPRVMEVNWEFDGHQMTHLTLSDRRAEPAPKRGGEL